MIIIMAKEVSSSFPLIINLAHQLQSREDKHQGLHSGEEINMVNSIKRNTRLVTNNYPLIMVRPTVMESTTKITTRKKTLEPRRRQLLL
jgi:hypothetical protein